MTDLKTNTLTSEHWLLRTPLRRRLLFVYLPIILLPAIGYLLWHPGKRINDGRFDLKQNGIWIGHGYLGDDAWFEKYNKQDQLKTTVAVMRFSNCSRRCKNITSPTSSRICVLQLPAVNCLVWILNKASCFLNWLRQTD